LVRFGGDSFKQQLMMIEKLNSGSEEPLSSKIFTRFVEGAQKRIEGNNFDARKNVLKYDDVLRKQREVIYRERRDVLLLDSVEDKIDQALENTINLEFDLGLLNNNEISFIDIFNQFTKNYLNKNFIEEENFDELTLQEKIEYTKNLCLREISNKKNETPAQVYNEFLKVIMLRVIDVHWTNHIDTMSELRQGVTLQSYGQMNPLVIYQKEGLNLFKNLSNNISKDITKYVLRAKIERSNEREQVVKNTSTNDTSQRSTKKPRKQKIRRNRSQRGRPF
jgi:preprotein translocase subunit SecA